MRRVELRTGGFRHGKTSGAAHKKCVIWLTIGLWSKGTDAGDKDVFDLGGQLAAAAVIDLLSVRDTGVSRDDECNPVSYGPFGPKRQKKIESTDPRVSGGYGRRRCPRAAAGQQPGRRLTPLLSCLNETARLEASEPPGNRQWPTSLGLLRRAHPRKE